MLLSMEFQGSVKRKKRTQISSTLHRWLPNRRPWTPLTGLAFPNETAGTPAWIKEMKLYLKKNDPFKIGLPYIC